MAEVTLTIGSRQYDVTCGDGEENHLIHLAQMIDSKMATMRQSLAGLTEIRQLLFAAILLADETHDLREEQRRHESRQATLDLPPVDDSAAEAAMAARINKIAARIETLADMLAQGDASS